MKPDLDDYEELNSTAEGQRSRAMSWLVLTVAVGGFAALAYYAYHSGTSGTEGGDVMVVQADQAPIKEVPADKGGEEFANKDKTIYDVITPGSGSGQGKVEKLMPDPEQPVNVHEIGDEDSATAGNNDSAPAPAAPATTTYVNKSLEKPSSNDGTEVKPATNAASANANGTASPATAAGAPTFVNEAPVATKATPVTDSTAKKPTVKTAAKPAAKTAAAPAKKPAAATASSGSSTIQLGAFKSEDEANAAWKKISGKFSDTLTGSPTIVKADLPNGTFYRLRTNVSSAKTACATLSAKGQACIAAK